MLTFTHTVTGRKFHAIEGEGAYGAATLDGHWDTGQAGTIWPAETFRDGTLCWTEAVR